MAGVIDDLSARLQEEADLCRNEGADDCAQLFDEANQSIETLHGQLRNLEAERDQLRIDLHVCQQLRDGFARNVQIVEAERDRLLQQIDEWVKKGGTRVKSIDLREERDRLRAENEALKSERAVWNCKTHGRRLNHWGCPDCVRELRDENEALRNLALHLRFCRECGETDVKHCEEGRALWSDAIDAAIAKERQP